MPDPARTRRRTPAQSKASSAPKTLQLGAIGVDSSHLPEFARRMQEMGAAGKTRCRLTQMWTDGQHDMPAEYVEKWGAQARAHGVVDCDDCDAMLDAVDGVLVLRVDGNKHLEDARKALTLGLPVYIDKPLACDLAEARTIKALADQYGARCYSASSLRFAREVEEAINNKSIGEIVAIEAYGPGNLSAVMDGLFYYGVHAIEMVDALWGPGVNRVRTTFMRDRDLVDLAYHDGRFAHLRMERQGGYEFGATLHGTKGVHSFCVNFDGVYDRLVAGMVGFFEGGQAPTSLDSLIENVAVMAAGNRSAAEDNRWVSLDELG